MPKVQKYGTFNDKEGKYCFDGRWYKPRWMANGVRNRNWVSIYSTVIEGYNATKPEPDNWPKSILVLCNVPGIMLWDQLKQSYSGIYAQSQLHYFDASIPAGQVPDWALPWQQSGFLLMHEYGGGKVAWLREGDFENDIYIFMEDTDAPEENNEPLASENPGSDLPPVYGSANVGSLLPMNSKIFIEWNTINSRPVPVKITVVPITQYSN